MTAYYNEIDPYAAQWLRNLIAAGHIAPGEVDERSLLDVCPDDLAGFTQCHFFAGIGVWSYALRLAGWPDSRPVWTGSCPCQPFSLAGVGGGFDDERHLWPFWFHLIEQCRPAVVFGEQVEAAIRHGWLDLVQADLEGIGYACAAAGIPAGGVGAPHIRQRLWFVADAAGNRQQREWARRTAEKRSHSRSRLAGQLPNGLERLGAARELADADQKQRGWRTDRKGLFADGAAGRWQQGYRVVESDCAIGHLADNTSERRGEAGASSGRPTQRATYDGATGQLDDDDARLEGLGGGHQAEGGRQGAFRSAAAASESGGLEYCACDGREQRRAESGGRCLACGCGTGGLADTSASGWGLVGRGGRAGEGEPGAYADLDHQGHRTRPADSHWRDADWLYCRDGKWRPVEPGTFPLAHGAPARVGRLRAYGNAIVPQVAAEVIRAYLECQP